MEPISCFLLVKDEEQAIEKVVLSIREVVDEVVVVDTGSKDETVEIANRLGAIVYHFEWCDDFSAARNYAQKKTKNRWVMFLDADWELKSSGPLEALSFDARDSFSVEWINQWEGDQKLSVQQRIILYDKTKYIWQGAVHEYLEYVGDSVESVEQLNWDVWHHRTESKHRNALYSRLVVQNFTRAQTNVQKNYALKFWVQERSAREDWTGIVKLVVDNLQLGIGDEDVIAIMEFFVVALRLTRQLEKYQGFFAST